MTAPSTAHLNGTYALDVTHTRLGFSARHAMVTKVRGNFETFEGSAELNFDDPSKSSASVSFDIDSVKTGQSQRDEHLRNNDFFDAPTFPKGTFVSTSASKIDDETFALTGDLTLKGVSKPVTITFEYTGSATDPYNNVRQGFEGKAVINRKDWGITYNAALEAGGVLISEKINLEFDVSAIKAA